MFQSATDAWIALLSDTLDRGVLVSPRGRNTKELLHRTIEVDMRKPVIMAEDRRLNYRFMAAEAYWILTGDNTVDGIARYNSHIAQFSDDGKTFFGAYGPRIAAQVNYVVSKLLEDPLSRQAGLTIWRENPPTTKDVPCTVAMFFNIRDWRLNCHVFMRSSDQWLGVPYDIFNFSCVAYMICCRLNLSSQDTDIRPGTLYLTAASSHLYETNWDAARSITQLPRRSLEPSLMVPRKWYITEGTLYGELRELREPDRSVSSLRWWKNA